MGPEGEVVEHVDNVACVVLVLFPQVLQYPYLLLGLSVEPLLIPDHLEGHVLVGLVVVHLQDLSKTSLPYHFQDLVAVGYVIVWDVCVGTLFIIISTVARTPDDPWSFLGICSDKVYLWIVEDLMVFVRRELVHV